VREWIAPLGEVEFLRLLRLLWFVAGGEFGGWTDSADVLAAYGSNLGLLGYIGCRLNRVAGNVDRLEIGLPVLAAVHERSDVIQRPFLSDDDHTADMALAAAVIEYALSDAWRGARVVGGSDPFFKLAAHLSRLPAEGDFGFQHGVGAVLQLTLKEFPWLVFCLALGNLLLDDFSAADLSGMDAICTATGHEGEE